MATKTTTKTSLKQPTAQERYDVNAYTFAELNAMYEALQALDGSQQIVGDKSIVVPYRLGDRARWAIVTNRRLIRPLVEDFAELQRKILMEISHDSGVIEQHIVQGSKSVLNPDFVAYHERIRKLTELTYEVPLRRLDIADLNMSPDTRGSRVNDIPPGVIDALYPILDGIPND